MDFSIYFFSRVQDLQRDAWVSDQGRKAAASAETR
jgi:hypothetical protein